MTGIAATANGLPIKNLSAFSVTEGGTPLSLTDSSGDAGQISLGFAAKTPSAIVKRYRGKTIELTDDQQGRIVGVGELANGSRNAPVLTAASGLVRLAVTRTADPFVGSLDAALRYYCELCGVDGGISIDPALALTAVKLLGWRDNVWIRLKALAARYRFEIAQVGEAVTFRLPRQILTEDVRDSQPVSWQIDASNLAQAIVVNYYNLESVEMGVVYPPRQVNPHAEEGLFAGLELITVAANETVRVVLPLTASVTSIQQPENMGDNWDPRYLVESGYMVCDATGHAVQPQAWREMGGNLTVQIGQEDAEGNWINDTRTLTLTFTGASNGSGGGPFTLGTPNGDGSYAPALCILGTGVTFLKKQIIVQTGISPDLAQQDIGATIDCDAVSSLGDAYDAAAHALGAYIGATQTITCTSTGINRPGISGVRPIFSFADFDAAYAGVGKFPAFDAKLGRTTFGQWDAAILRAQAAEFDHQAFGNVGGARRYFEDAYYRIRQATISRETVQYQAEMDVTFGDFDAKWAGKKFSDFDRAWNGATFGDLDVAPLAAELPGGAADTSTGYLRSTAPSKVASLNLARGSAMQCAVYAVGRSQEWYASQATQSDAASGEETTTITRTRADGTYKDSMVLLNAGHGTTFVPEWDGVQMWIWLTWGQPATGGGRNDLVRFKYQAGTWTRGQVPALATVVPGGGAYRTVAFDWQNDWAVIRYGGASSERYDRVRISGLRWGDTTAHGSITVPVSPPTLQGFLTIGDSMIRYTGVGAGDPTPTNDPPLLTEYDWNSGAVLNVINTGDIGRLHDGTFTADHREPEGVTLYRNGTGMAVAHVGLITGTSGAYDYQVWRYPLVKGVA